MRLPVGLGGTREVRFDPLLDLVRDDLVTRRGRRWLVAAGEEGEKQE